MREHYKSYEKPGGVNRPQAVTLPTGQRSAWSVAAIMALFFLITLFSANKGHAATTVSLSTPASVGTASMCPGTNQQVIYRFTLVATGIFPTTTLTGIDFSQSGTASASDVVRYQLWADAPGGTLVASSTTTSFSGLSTVYNGVFGTTINYWITADISPTATAGRTIVVDAMTTADFTTTSGFKTTFGTIADGGSQTVLLAPGAITGSTAVCVTASSTLSNAVAGGTWTSSNTALAAIGSTSGVLAGVAAGSTDITYELSTGCLTTTTVTVNALPALETMTGGGNYCTDGAGVHIGLAASEAGIYYQLYNGATLSGSATGTGTAVDFGLLTAAGAYTVMANNTTTSCHRSMAGAATVGINPLPNDYAVTGGGAYCSGSSGVHIGLANTESGISYRLYKGATAVGLPVAGSGSAIDFGIYTSAGTYSVLATNTSTSCTNSMSGTASVIVNSLPTAYTVLGGGSYCAGGTGVHIRLSWSQTGVVYILYNGSTVVGSPVAGTGLLLDFGLQTAAGNYTVVAMNASTFCTRNMYGSATISIDAAPAVHSVTGGGAFCADGTGVHVGMSASESGVMYMLYNGATLASSPMAGTGAALDFGLQTDAGTYSVVAVNSATTCISDMAGTATVVVNPLPAVYDVTGGGSYCSGDPGVHVGLSGSGSGISYQLYHGTATVGSPMAGTGSALDFGFVSAAGIYTVHATNISTGCTKNMTGSTSVAINPLPVIFNVTGGGRYCTHGVVGPTITPADAGSTAIHVRLDSSETGVIYLLYNGSIAVSSPVSGTGGPLDFGVLYASGTYRVLAINTITLCTQSMADSALITIEPVVVPMVNISSPSGNNACSGTPVTFTALISDGGTAPVYSWSVNGLTSDTSSSFTYTPANGDTVTLSLTSNAVCAEPATVMDQMIMNVIAPVIPAVTIAADPGLNFAPGTSVTFTAGIVNGGTAPAIQWSVNGTIVPGATNASYTTNSLANNDSVSCSVTRNDVCSMTSYNSVVVTVGVGVHDISRNAVVTVAPNPSNGTFRVKGELGADDKEAVIEVLNMVGQVVYSRSVAMVNGSLDENVSVANVTSGMYVLHVKTTTGDTRVNIVIQ